MGCVFFFTVTYCWPCDCEYCNCFVDISSSTCYPCSMSNRRWALRRARTSKNFISSCQCL